MVLKMAVMMVYSMALKMVAMCRYPRRNSTRCIRWHTVEPPLMPISHRLFLLRHVSVTTIYTTIAVAVAVAVANTTKTTHVSLSRKPHIYNSFYSCHRFTTVTAFNTSTILLMVFLKIWFFPSCCRSDYSQDPTIATIIACNVR